MSSPSSPSNLLGSDLSNVRQNLFKKLDANSDGKVSKSEFVLGRPQGVSEAQATDLFSAIDSGGTGAVTQDQLDSGLEANRPRSLAQAGRFSSDAMSILLQNQQQGDDFTVSKNNSAASDALNLASSDNVYFDDVFSQISKAISAYSSGANTNMASNATNAVTGVADNSAALNAVDLDKLFVS